MPQFCDSPINPIQFGNIPNTEGGLIYLNFVTVLLTPYNLVIPPTLRVA